MDGMNRVVIPPFSNIMGTKWGIGEENGSFGLTKLNTY